MKRKLLFMMLCIMGVLTLSAQTDYTSYVDTSKDSWTGSSGTYGVGVTTFDGRTGDMVEFYGSSDAGVKMKQTVEGLEEGMYEVTVFATSHNAWGNFGANLQGNANDVAYVYALADGTTLKTFFTAYQNGWIVDGEPAKVTVSDIVVRNGTLEIGLALAKSGQTEWQGIQIYQLTRTGDISLDSFINRYNEAMENAQAAAEKKMAASVLDALNATIAANSNPAQTEAALVAAAEALEAACENAAPSIASYALIAGKTIPTNTASGWAISTPAGALACNGWSTEGATDGSGMLTPFIQDWISSGGQLGAGKLYYTISNLEPGEKFNVTARVRILNESGGSVAGGYFFANNQTVDVEENGTAINHGKYGVFHLTAEADANGVLQFGIQIADGSAINWVNIRDVEVSEYAGVNPTAIQLSENSLSLEIGESVALTATVTPDNADDKTVAWTTSNANVAVVNANGTVSAVGPGTATITATSNAVSSVTAACSVSVGGPELPSVYSTEIEDGEVYFIINASSGKYLGGANSWGTQMSQIEHGIPFTATKIQDGVYTFDSKTYNSDTEHFLAWGYIDGGATNYTLISAGDGLFNIKLGDGYLTAQAGNSIVATNGTSTTDVKAQWYFVSKADREKMLADATAANPVDATFYIDDPNHSRNHWPAGLNVSSWTIDTSNYNLKGGDNSNMCAESYRAKFNISQELDVPNGTYKLRVQACAGSASPAAVVFANDQETPFKTRDGGESSMANCSSSFSAGKYFTDWVEVTVTDNKLTIGVKSDSDGDWCVWDNYELYMIGYTAVESIDATIDNDEIEEGSTAQITATVSPDNASFDKPTYTSSDESVATVDEDGVVTAVAEGQATITIAAQNEDVSATIDVTVVAPAVAPESITVFSDGEEVVLLTLDETSAVTLTAEVNPEGAPQGVTFESSDESVVTVSSEGVVTPVLPGDAVITVRSQADTSVEAEVAVSVTFPETEVPAYTYVNSNETRTYYELSDENLIQNGAFEYPDAFYNWTSANNFTDKITSSKFRIDEENGNHYLVGTVNEGAGAAGSLGVAWPIEAGKTYMFSYRVKSLGTAAGDQQYLKTSLTNTKGTETNVLGTPTLTAGEWTTVEYQFTNYEEYQFLQIKFRWLSGQFGFDDFRLTEIANEKIVGNVDYITENVPTGNIGTGVFQYSQEAIDDALALVQATPENGYEGAIPDEVYWAYYTMVTLNSPKANQRYAIVVATPDHPMEGNAIVAKAGATGNNNPTGYGFNASAEPNVNLAQAWGFENVAEGYINTYKLFYTNENGEYVYLTYGTNNGSAAGWSDSQIQGTTDENAAGLFEIVATNTDNVFNIKNLITGETIACQNGGNIYTEPDNADFSVVPVEPAVVEVAIAEGAYATRMFPFKPELPYGVVAYEVENMDNNTLVMTEVADPQANTPYILFSEEEEIGEDCEGYGTAASLDPVEKGLLVGTLDAQNTVEAGNYVLQTLDGGQKFYRVGSDITNYPAYRAYLKGNGSEVKAINLVNDEPTGINNVTEGAFDFSNIEGVYNVSGAKIGRMQKGMNVVRMKDGSVRKVLVK